MTSCDVCKAPGVNEGLTIDGAAFCQSCGQAKFGDHFAMIVQRAQEAGMRGKREVSITIPPPLEPCDKCARTMEVLRFTDAKGKWPYGMAGAFCQSCTITVLRDQFIFDIAEAERRGEVKPHERTVRILDAMNAAQAIVRRQRDGGEWKRSVL